MSRTVVETEGTRILEYAFVKAQHVSREQGVIVKGKLANLHADEGLNSDRLERRRDVVLRDVLEAKTTKTTENSSRKAATTTTTWFVSRVGAPQVLFFGGGRGGKGEVPLSWRRALFVLTEPALQASHQTRQGLVSEEGGVRSDAARPLLSRGRLGTPLARQARAGTWYPQPENTTRGEPLEDTLLHTCKLRSMFLPWVFTGSGVSTTPNGCGRQLHGP